MSERVYAVQFSLTAPYDEGKSRNENLSVLKAALTSVVNSVPELQMAQNTFSAAVRTSPTCPECQGESPYHFAGCRRDTNSGKVIEGRG